MKLHPRTQIVARAEGELNRLISDWTIRHDITSIELPQILAARTQDELKYLL